MPMVNINTWKMNDQAKVKTLLEEITLAVHKNTGAPLDKISVCITEIDPSRWADAGILGDSPDFPVKSRRKNYGDE